MVVGIGNEAATVWQLEQGIFPVNLNTPLEIPVNTQVLYLVLVLIEQAVTGVQL